MATRRVLIGTPSYDGRVEVLYTHCLLNTVRLGMQRGVDLRELFLCYEAIIQNLRNDIVAAAIKNDFDDLIFIDSDQAWDPEWVFKLLAYPVDCVGGTVRKKTDQAELYNVRTANIFNLKQASVPGLLTADDLALGTGFLRLSKRALRALWDSSEAYSVFGKEEARWIFDIRPENGVLVGEDTKVSDKLRLLGIPTHLDPAMTCDHVGVKRYQGNFQNYLARAIAQNIDKVPTADKPVKPPRKKREKPQLKVVGE